MVDFLRIIDFSKEIKANPELGAHLTKSSLELSEKLKNDENYKQPFFDQALDHIVIVTNLPVVDTSKVQALYNFLKTRLTLLELPEPEGVAFNIVGTQMTGSCILEFADSETAKNAAAKLNDFKFDGKHTLVACTSEEFDHLMNLNDKYQPPKVVPKNELQEWLLDPRLREQFLIRTQDKHYLQWWDHIQKEFDPIFASKTFANEYGHVTKTTWSRNGSYLVTFHDKGFCLWGGKQFEFISFFEHHQAKEIDFSPEEDYVLSFNGTVIEAPNTENYVVWRVGTIEKLRSFKAEQHETWGAYKWNFDGQLIANCSNDQLNIYELPAMAKIIEPNSGKRCSLKIANVQSFEWAPNKNFLSVAAYSLQRATVSKTENWGKVYLIELPSRRDHKWKTITWEFTSCKMHWDPSGHRVVLVFTKVKGKKTSTIIQVGDLSTPNLAVEEHEFNDVKCVNVSEDARRIAVVSTDQFQKEVQSGTIRYNVELFKVDDQVKGKFLHRVGVLTDKTLSHVLWPNNSGTFYALVNTDKLSANIGYLEFGFIKSNNTVESIKNLKFPYMIHAAWDASGRCLVTQSEKGHYTIWNAYGEPLMKDNFTELSQLLWRPKPRIVLSLEAENDINKNLKKYTQKYEEEDDKIINKIKYEKERVRNEQKNQFMAYFNKKREAWQETKEQRVKLLGFDEDSLSDLEYDEIVESEDILEGKK